MALLSVVSRWEDLAILKRSSLLTVLILLAIVAVGVRTYLLWKEGPWDLPTVVKRPATVEATDAKPEATPRPLVSTDMIVSKNLFDPERGASRTREAEADSRALQRIRSFVLLGTAILGSNRYAILQEGGPGSAPMPPGRPPGPLRFKVGDVVEGFSLSEIRDKNVVFSKGASRVELALDYFRKAEAPAPARPPIPQPGVAGNVPAPGPAGPATPPVPRVFPQLPRRQRLPAPPNP
jgi:hypothetical protein